MKAAILLFAVVVVGANAVLADDTQKSCRLDELNFEGTYLCWDDSAILAYSGADEDDYNVFASRTNETRPFRSGPDRRSWYFLNVNRLPEPYAADSYGFEAQIGTFDLYGRVQDSNALSFSGMFTNLFMAGESHESNAVEPALCTMKMSQASYWEAECLSYVRDDINLQLEFDGANGCEPEYLYNTLGSRSFFTLAGRLSTSKCTKDDGFLADDFEELLTSLLDSIEQELSDEPELESPPPPVPECEEGFTLVHEEGAQQNGRTISLTVEEGECSQFCVPDFVVMLLSVQNPPMLEGSCSGIGYPVWVEERYANVG